jgi:PAS domain S-box-containing protein
LPNLRTVHKEPAQLRRLAEQRWKSQKQDFPRLSDESEVRKLLHELQVHQIELEIQNEELQTARDEVAALLDGYAELYDLAPVGFLTLTANGKIKHANLTAASILGEERSRLLGSSFPHYLADRSRKAFANYTAVRLAGIANTSCDLALRATDQRTTWIQIESSNRSPASAEELKIAFFDITERKRVEEEHRRYEAEFQHTQKLESLGALAAGVAHDMNNVLAAIGLVAQTLKAGAGEALDLDRALDIINRATNRGRDMVGRLTTFARKELREPEPIDLIALLQEEVNLLKRTTLQKIEVVLELEPAPIWVLGERTRLEGTLMNLCGNAMEAMPEGGRLTLGVHRMPGSRVRIFVKDTGVGMPPEVLERATEPFFTTKSRPEASGLGLRWLTPLPAPTGGA